jgi:hypothetical protein
MPSSLQSTSGRSFRPTLADRASQHFLETLLIMALLGPNVRGARGLAQPQLD